MAQETYSARQLAVRVSKTIGRTVSPKQIRGRVRGDAGTPLLDRFGAEKRGDYASHVYSVAEANKIGAAFVTAHNKRSGGNVRWSPLGGRATLPKRLVATKPEVTAPPKVAKATSATPVATDTPEA